MIALINQIIDCGNVDCLRHIPIKGSEDEEICRFGDDLITGGDLNGNVVGRPVPML